MPIDRTLFNALLESDGSPNSGDVISKQVLIDTILDPVDAALAAATGDVSGPASSVDDRIATFDGTTGKIIQDGGQTIAQLLASAPAAHHTSHENGGSDEISVVGLSGLLADGHTPLAHKTSHQSGGSDAIKIDDLAAADDNTDLNASTSAHGLLKKLSNVSTEFMNGQGNWATPAGGGGGVTVLARDVTVQDVANTTSETTVFTTSVAGGTLGSTGKLRARLLGDYLNNSGSNSTLLINVYYGGTQIGVWGVSVAADAARRMCEGTIELSAFNATNAQVSQTRITLSPAGVAGNADATEANVRVSGSRSLAVDSTSAQNFEIKVAHSVAASTISFRCQAVHLELL